MKNTLSSHYFLNRYSYFIYFCFCAIFLVRTKLNNLVPTKDDITFFVIINVFYILWIFVYGTFHFSEQTKVSRVDYQTLRFTKGLNSTDITKSDIAQIFIQLIIYPTTRANPYKILVITKKGEKYRFIYIPKSKVSNSNSIDIFLQETEYFWGLADINTVHLSPNTLFCN